MNRTGVSAFLAPALVAAQQQQPADLIVANARISTADDAQPLDAAMSIRGGRVQFVGSGRGAMVGATHVGGNAVYERRSAVP
jgi:hypothetical protein